MNRCLLPFASRSNSTVHTKLHGGGLTGPSLCSRAYIRAVEEDDQMPVPSPTYLLQNVYEYDDGELQTHEVLPVRTPFLDNIQPLGVKPQGR